MMQAFHSEWRKLARGPVLTGLVAAAIGFSLLSTLVRFATATSGHAARTSSPGPSTTTVSSLESAHGLASGIAGSAQFLGIVALAFCAQSFAAEFQHGTIRNLLIRQPKRGTLLAGKFLALGTVLVPTGLIAAITALLCAYPAAGVNGIDTSQWSGLAADGHAALAALGLAGAMLGYGLMGALLGLALRSSAMAIGIGIAYALPVETIVASAWSTSKQFLPGQILQSLPDVSLSDPQLASIVGLAAIAVLLIRRWLIRADITA